MADRLCAGRGLASQNCPGLYHPTCTGHQPASMCTHHQTWGHDKKGCQLGLSPHTLMAEDHAHPEEDIPESQPVDFCTSLSVSRQRREHYRRHGAAPPANLERTLIGGSNAVLSYARTRAYIGYPAQIHLQQDLNRRSCPEMPILPQLSS